MTGAGAANRDARVPSPHRAGFRTRAMLAVGLALSAAMILTTGLSLGGEYAAHGRALSTRVERTAAVQAEAAAVPLWDYNVQQIDALLEALSRDDDFAAARVLDERGSPVAARGRLGGDGRVGAERPILYPAEDGVRRIGTLRLELSTDAVRRALTRIVLRGAATLVLLLAVVLATLHLAFRWVALPLKRTARAMIRLADGDLAADAPAPDTADEIGDLARAFRVFKANAVGLRLAEERYRAIVENVAIGIYQCSPDGRLLRCNPALARVLGHADEGEALAALAAPGSLDRLHVDPGRRSAFVSTLHRRNVITGFTAAFRRHDGGTAWLSMSARAVRDAAGVVLYHEGTAEDVTERRRAAEIERLRVLEAVRSVSDAVLISGEDGGTTFVNAAFGTLLGFDAAGLDAAGGLAVLFDDERAGRVMTTLSVGGAWEGEAGMRTRGGRSFTASVRANAIRDDAGRIVGSVCLIADVTERRRTEARVRHMAHHDSLTGLPNRALFRERLERLFAEGRGRETPAALLLIDLDRFKEVNDRLGHDAGDDLLRAAAARLRGCVRPGDTAARLGGDEFAVILAGDGDRGAGFDAAARRVVDALSDPFVLDGRAARVGASVGMALHPRHASGPDELLRHADLALYRAKAGGRGDVAVFEAGMAEDVRARKAIEDDMRLALARERFELHYQPRLALRSREVTTVEALLRWNHPTRGAVPPGEFIPIAEGNGLIRPLGAWALGAACRQAAAWPDVRVAVNLSPVQLAHDDVVDAVERALEASGLPPGRLELEITESVLVNAAEDALGKLRRLKDLGVGLAMDDFGTGYSSLASLRKLPFDTVKIDRSFVRRLGVDARDEAILRAIVTMSRTLGLVTVAEGVETAAQLTFLERVGCDAIQGHVFEWALPADDVARVLAGRRTGAAPTQAAVGFSNTLTFDMCARS